MRLELGVHYEQENVDPSYADLFFPSDRVHDFCNQSAEGKRL